MTDDNESPKEEKDPGGKLEEILDDSEAKGEEIAQFGRDLTEAGQSMADMARATRDVVHVVKAPPNIEFLINDWDLTNQQADVVIGQIGKVDVPSFTSASGTSSSTSTDSFEQAQLFSIVPEDEHPLLVTVLENFNQVSERAANAEEVANLMRSLGLDVAAQGRKSPLEQFETAHAAFRAPVAGDNPVVTSLLPMRESIRATIDFLLKRRPKQEKTRKEWGKIVSIGNQLKRDDLLASVVNSWAAQWTHALQTYLSPAKEEDLDRDEWRRRLVRSTLFLKGFLGGIDPSKLRT